MIHLLDKTTLPQMKQSLTKFFIEGFHTLYKMKIDELHTAALFNAGTSINVLSFKFNSKMQHQLKLLPISRKVVSANGNSLGFIGEVHLKVQDM